MAWLFERLFAAVLCRGDRCCFRKTDLVVGLSGRALLEISIQQLLVSYRTLDKAGGEGTTRMNF